jgi:hypothetical protein
VCLIPNKELMVVKDGQKVGEFHFSEKNVAFPLYLFLIFTEHLLSKYLTKNGGFFPAIILELYTFVNTDTPSHCILQRR